MSTFDYNDDGYIDVEDFLLFILPQGDRDMRRRAENKVDSESLFIRPHEQFICEISRLLVLEANYHKAVDEKRILVHEELTCSEAFQLITGGKEITLEEMRNFVLLLEPEFEALYRRINDRLDYEITFDEFERHVWTKVRKETFAKKKTEVKDITVLA